MARFSALARAAHFAGNAVRNQTQNHVLTTVRPFASAADVARVSDDSFCKWTNPVPQTRLHTADLAGPETKVTTLPNGLRVATETTPFATTATVGVWIDAGSRFETSENNGTAHFLEHMAFKGTSSRRMRQLEEEVENMGAHLNAYTSREQTTYYAKVMEKDIPKAVEILSDILQNSTLDESCIENERNVILREMEEVEGVPEEVLFDHLHATAFQYTPLGRCILGPAENIRTISKADLTQYIATHYSAPRMVVVGAGAVDHDALVKEVAAKFANLPAGSASAADMVKSSPAAFTGSEIRFRNDDMPKCHLAIAVEGVSWSHPDAITLMVMQAMLGAWDENSTAGVNVATQLGQRIAANSLADSYMAFNTNYADTGLFGISAVANGGEDLEDLVWCMMREFTALCYTVEEEDVIRAQNAIKSSLTLHLDGTSPVAEDIGRQMLTYGRRIPKAELFARIDAVTAKHVKAAGMKYIYDKDFAMVAMGPCQYIPDYNWIRRQLYWQEM